VGAVYVYSGARKQVLYKYTGYHSGEFLGYDVCKTGDLNQDGHGDFAYLTLNNGQFPADVGVVTIRSGIDGILIHEIWGQDPGNQLREIAYGGDVNNDGWPDLLVGQPWYDSSLSNMGRAYVYSGKDWSVLYMYTGILEEQRLGTRISTAGDVNGDGCNDFLILGGPDEPGHILAGAIYLHSGQDGSLLAYFYGADNAKIGVDIHGGVDVNGDGLPDIINGTGEDIAGQSYAGSAIVYVSKSFQATDEVPLGGNLELNLRVPAQPLGFYFLAFSLDKEPGIPVGTRTLPLNWDALFNITFANPAFCGNLDSDGDRQIVLFVPNDPALSGLTIYSAFLTLKSGAPMGVGTISNPEETLLH
jgi:hypothetical protein